MNKINKRVRAFIILCLAAVLSFGAFFLLKNDSGVAFATASDFVAGPNTTVTEDGSTVCPNKISFTTASDSANSYVTSNGKINLTDFSMSFDFSGTVHPDNDHYLNPWVFLYFTSSANSFIGSGNKSILISLSLDPNSDELRAHFFKNELSDSANAGSILAPSIVMNSTSGRVLKITSTIANGDITFKFFMSGEQQYSVGCALSTFTDSSYCSFDPTSCYIGLGAHFPKAHSFLASDIFYHAPVTPDDPTPDDPSGPAGPNADFVSTGVEGFTTSGNMGIAKRSDKVSVDFRVTSNTNDNSAILSDAQFTVDKARFDLVVTSGFTVGKAEIVVALKTEKTAWVRENSSPTGYNGIYVLIKRISSDRVSFAVYSYKDTSTSGDYTKHQRGETSEAPFDSTTGVLDVYFTKSADGDFIDIRVNGVYLENILLSNEVKNIFGTGNVEEAKGHLLVQVKSNSEQVDGYLADMLTKSEEAAGGGGSSGCGGNIGSTLYMVGGTLVLLGIIAAIKRKITQ